MELPDEGISHGQTWITAEISVCGPKLADTMVQADGSDSSIVNLGTDDFSLQSKMLEFRIVPFVFSQQGEGR